MLKKRFRLTKKDNFELLFNAGKKVQTAFFLARYIENTHGHNRFAVVVSKKVEKSSVKRNRVRRKLYEALRHSHFIRTEGTSHDILLLINKSALSAPYTALYEEVENTKL